MTIDYTIKQSYAAAHVVVKHPVHNPENEVVIHPKSTNCSGLASQVGV